MDERAKARLKRRFGMTDAEVEQAPPHVEKIALAFSRLQQYRIIAEATGSSFCGAGIQPGQKYVFSAMLPLLDSLKSDCPACIRALGPVINLVDNVIDRLIEGLDPNGAIHQVAECLDTGLGHGGLGKVYFRVYAEKIA